MYDSDYDSENDDDSVVFLATAIATSATMSGATACKGPLKKVLKGIYQFPEALDGLWYKALSKALRRHSE